MSTEIISLGEAARIASVSQTTMRSWVHKIEGAKKGPSGYEIPKPSLLIFLSDRSKVGAVRGATVHGSPESAPLQSSGELRAQEEVQWLRGELRDAREQLKEAQGEIRKLEAELRAHLSGSRIGGALSRWIKGR